MGKRAVTSGKVRRLEAWDSGRAVVKAEVTDKTVLGRRRRRPNEKRKKTRYKSAAMDLRVY